MAATFTVLNPGVGGDIMDEELTVYAVFPFQRKKPRVALAGNAPDGVDIILPLAGSPTGAEYALPTRNMPATPTTSGLAGIEINAAAPGDNIIIAGVGGQTIRVFKLFLVVAAAVGLAFKDGAGGFTPAIPFSAFGAMVLDFDSQPWFVTSAGNDFVINLSVGVQVSGRILYTQS